MAPAAVAVASGDQTAELLEKMTLETQTKASNGSDAVKKESDKPYGYKANAVNGQVPSYERSTTPMQSEYMDPSMCYPVNSYPYYYGAYDGTQQGWSEYMQYLNAEGVEAPAGVYGDNGSLVYHHGYGYTPYPYSPATSPGPTIDASHQYQYPVSYYPSMTANGAPFTPNSTIAKQGDLKEVAAEQRPKPVSSEIANSGGLKSNNGSVLSKSTHTNPAFNAKGSLENSRSTSQKGFPASGYQDPRFGYGASRLPLWSDGQLTSSAVTSSVASVNSASRNQILRPQNQLVSRPMTGNGANNGFYNRIFTNPIHSVYGYGYDSRTNGRGYLPIDAKYRPRGRGNGFYGFGNENADGLNELNRGPRAKRNIKGFASITSVFKDQSEPAQAATGEEKNNLTGSPVAEHYNLPDFTVDYPDAKFFVIKSYSEDDVHKSIKYNVWASTPNGNKKLDAAYQQAQEKSANCPVFLFFSVNASGQFVGLAEMVSSVDFEKSLEYWQQDKWNGCFSLKWHIVKDVPNTLLKHIILENNENKPVTNSRDTQEVKLEQGLQMLKIFKDHSSRSSILDDFEFYEARQKAIQEKKVRLQFQKQVWEGKAVDVKSQDGAKGERNVFNSFEAASNLTKEALPAVHANGDAKIDDNGSVAKSGDGLKVVTPVAAN